MFKSEPEPDPVRFAYPKEAGNKLKRLQTRYVTWRSGLPKAKITPLLALHILLQCSFFNMIPTDSPNLINQEFTKIIKEIKYPVTRV